MSNRKKKLDRNKTSKWRFFKSRVLQVYLEPSRASMMELFRESS